MDWGHFPYFLALSRGGTLAAAARQLRVDQATVGRRIRALEASCEARLFDRTPDGYRLTPAGQAMLSALDLVEQGVESMRLHLSGQDERVEGTVCIAAGESFSISFLVPRLEALRTRHPGIQIEITTGNLPHDLARREADIALRIGPRPKQANLVVRRPVDVAIALYAARTYLARRGTPSQKTDSKGALFSGHDLVVYGGDLADIAGARFLSDMAGQAASVLTTNSMPAAEAAVRAGLGIGLLPCYAADRDPDLEPLPPGIVAKHKLWLTVHTEVRKSARVRAVVDFLADLVEREAALLDGTRARQAP